MKENNILKNKKRLLIVNLFLTIVYLIIYPKLIMAEDMSFVGVLLSIVIPSAVLYFTCPIYKNGMKISLIFVGIFMAIYYTIQKERLVGDIMSTVDIMAKGQMLTEMDFVNMMTTARNIETYANIGIVFAIILVVLGTGIVNKLIRKKNEGETSFSLKDSETKTTEYIYYDKEGNVSDTPTTHKVLKWS
ncbi:MAG: hypothetical protein IKC07_05800 [Clostridia bacterium]|nr:hypothetical protein [Clostridia bacterium]